MNKKILTTSLSVVFFLSGCAISNQKDISQDIKIHTEKYSIFNASEILEDNTNSLLQNAMIVMKKEGFRNVSFYKDYFDRKIIKTKNFENYLDYLDFLRSNDYTNKFYILNGSYAVNKSNKDYAILALDYKLQYDDMDSFLEHFKEIRISIPIDVIDKTTLFSILSSYNIFINEKGIPNFYIDNRDGRFRSIYFEDVINLIKKNIGKNIFFAYDIKRDEFVLDTKPYTYYFSPYKYKIAKELLRDIPESLKFNDKEKTISGSFSLKTIPIVSFLSLDNKNFSNFRFLVCSNKKEYNSCHIVPEGYNKNKKENLEVISLEKENFYVYYKNGSIYPINTNKNKAIIDDVIIYFY